jgi:hypothetical protein
LAKFFRRKKTSPSPPSRYTQLRHPQTYLSSFFFADDAIGTGSTHATAPQWKSANTHFIFFIFLCHIVKNDVAKPTGSKENIYLGFFASPNPASTFFCKMIGKRTKSTLRYPLTKKCGECNQPVPTESSVKKIYPNLF